MERDFLGLNSTEHLVVVKEEITDGAKDSDFVGFAQGSGMQWPFLNKGPALPHFMSFKAAQEDKSKRVAGEDPTGEVQNIAGASPNQQLVGGVPVTAAHPTLYSVGSIAGFPEQWNNAKESGSPAQFTIFYGGTVNVYNDLSPEQAQAIMFLAVNGSSMASNAIHQKSQLQPPCSNVAANDGVIVNQTVPAGGLSSPMSVSSRTGAQSGSGSTSNNELLQATTTRVSVTPVIRVDTPKIVNSPGHVIAATIIQSAIPQARKASLARFLEKRKERVMNAAAPYDLSKKSTECATQGSNSMNVNASTNSGVGCGYSD